MGDASIMVPLETMSPLVAYPIILFKLVFLSKFPAILSCIGASAPSSLFICHICLSLDRITPMHIISYDFVWQLVLFIGSVYSTSGAAPLPTPASS